LFACSLDESADAHETAADVICALLEMLNPDEDPGDDMLCLEMNVLAAVLNLEPCYLAVRELEDLDRSHNFCRVFTELAETFLTKIVVSSNPGSHFAMPVFNAVVACCSQNDYEIADVTFNLWYLLSNKNSRLSLKFMLPKAPNMCNNQTNLTVVCIVSYFCTTGSKCTLVSDLTLKG